jgi:KUP system potassium uptake protein
MTNHHTLDIRKLSTAGFLIATGIVFGDIGTSPLYTFKAIIQDAPVNRALVMGSVSAVFWTLFFQTTLKYVIITLKADNNGEGGIFSLYTLIRRYRKWLIVPALLGGSFLMADSIITPPISVTSAIEGLKMQYPSIPVIPIVLVILSILFLLQAMGSSRIGKIFGPAMMIWFTMIGIMGLYALSKDLSVLKAVNPVYAFRFVTEYPRGFWLLGAVFLCTTGAEALYSDLGHCGRKNIEASWTFIKICLVLCYFGQAAWLVNHEGMVMGDVNSFFAMMPGWMFWPAVCIATVAAIIASQALISGTFTLINEAIRLNLFPRLNVIYPSEVRGQLYIPAVNWALFAGCIGAVLFFRESKNMEAAFGLSVTLTMLMTTVLLIFYMYSKRRNLFFIVSLTLLFLTIETTFLVANLQKFKEGGFITLLLGLFLFWVMFTWQYAGKIKNGLIRFVGLKPHIPMLEALSNDKEIPKYATHLVYLTNSTRQEKIEERIIESIYYKFPKRADLYWFVHIHVTDEPFTTEYKAEVIQKDEVMRVTFNLGFRIVPRINVLFKKVLSDLYEQKEFNVSDSHKSFYRHFPAGEYRFIVFESYLSQENELPLWKRIPMKLYFMLKSIELDSKRSFGLEESTVTEEKLPLVIESPQNIYLKRITDSYA